MKIQIAAPLALHERGQRPNNEDHLFPSPGKTTSDDRLFLVCDGVGGVDKGEIASAITCHSIPHYFSQNRIKSSDEQTINNAVAYAEAELERHIKAYPGTANMATTLTLLHLHNQGATVAHIGDSRIYHVRNGRICWRSQDHSYVNELVKSGIIGSEEARKHPKRNVITRALQGNKTPVKADVHVIEDLRGDDYLFLCTDGILEAFEESDLMEILGNQQSNLEKIAQVQKQCQAKSHDNFTAYLIQIQSVEHLDIELIPGFENSSSKISKAKSPAKPKSSKQLMWALTLVNIVLFAAMAYFFLWNNKKEESPKEKAKEKIKTEIPVAAPIPEKDKNKFENYEAQKIKKKRKTK
jgi:protein phosphatase